MDKRCSVYKTMNFAGKRWTLLILLELHKGNGCRRYSLLKNAMPEITGKILSTRLKELEKEGLVAKNVRKEPFLSCEYSLTESGNDFVKIIKYIKKWSLKWRAKNKLCEEKECKDCEL